MFEFSGILIICEEDDFDLVVLSVGLQIPEHVKKLSSMAGVRLTSDNFVATSDFSPVSTSKKGIFTCGAFAGPKDIPQSVLEGSAAAAAVADILAPARGELTQEKSFPEESKRLRAKIEDEVSDKYTMLKMMADAGKE